MTAIRSEASRALAVSPAGRRRPAPVVRRLAWQLLVRAGPPLVALIALAVAWESWVRIAGVDSFVLPPPSAVLRRFVADRGLLAHEASRTALEALAGFAVGSAIAVGFAATMAASRALERALFPIAVLVKVTPIVAVAPLLTIWFGFGLAPKIFIETLIVFFPVLVGGVTGFRAVDPAALDFFRSVHAGPWETFWKLRVPSSLPYLLASFRVAITLAVIGAVVAEWFSGGDHGLGRVVQTANYNLDLELAFAAVLALAIVGIALYLAVTLIERRLLRWHSSVRSLD